MWEEIARELNRKFGTKRTGDKCKKINFLIERYKIVKYWNSKQTGGHRRQSFFYEEIDSVLGCRDVVALQHVAEAGTSETVSAAFESAGQEMSPEARRDHKKKRRRATAKEQDEEIEPIKSFESGMERQRQDMNKFMENFTAVQQQQVNNMNLLVGALTTFLKNNINNK